MSDTSNLAYCIMAAKGRKATLLSGTSSKNLDDYCKMMSSRGQTSWEVGWESLPKYIGHKIYNRNTNTVAVVNWDEGYPRLFDKEDHKVPCCANDFRHGDGYWIYMIGENYDNQDRYLKEE